MGIVLTGDIPAGHKFALATVAAGQSVIKLGEHIGVASQTIAPGEHVHSHNLAFVPQPAGAIAGSAVRPVVPAAARRFLGYVRADGRVGTRNYVAIGTSVNCSATAARRIAAHFTPERLAAWPHVDGVAAFTHNSGCGMAHSGDGIDYLRRTIAGHLAHPNVGAALLLGLGCEVNQPDALMAANGLAEHAGLRRLGIQAEGGSRAAIHRGIEVVEELLDIANRSQRTPADARHLVIGLQCGGSDGYSALTANPALGNAADRLVAIGGAVILSETPEIFGAEHLLLARAANSAIAAALIDRITWWRAYAAQNGADLNNNPSPGNIAGGITTILEKSLGAVAKSGSSPLQSVLRYAEPVKGPGFHFMDTPGYDPCSATGQIAGGANLILFTTGRGSVFGSKPAPTLKLASNSALAARMPDDIDIDCGRLLDGGISLDDLGAEILAAILAAASGQPTKSELEDMGDAEFIPWVPGAAM